MTDRRRHNRVEEPTHGRTTGPVYYLGPDDQWVLGELTVNEQWLTFDGTTDNVSHAMPNVICVNALDFYNYFESYCFELVCVQPSSLGTDSKGHRSRAPSRQQILLSSQSNVTSSFAGLSEAVGGRRDGQSPGASTIEPFVSPGRAERDRGVDYKNAEASTNLLSPNAHLHISPTHNNTNAMYVFPTGPLGDGPVSGNGIPLLSSNGVPLLPLGNLASNANGRQSPVNSTSAVRNGGDSFSVTPVLTPATSFQDGVKGFFVGGGANFEHTITPPQQNTTNGTSSSNPALNSNNTIATPTVVSNPSFQIPSNVPSERIVFKALSMNDYLSWLSVFDQYLDLAVLNKCGMVIPNVAVEPSDEFGHLYKSFAAYGERLPDPNPMLLTDEIGLNF